MTLLYAVGGRQKADATDHSARWDHYAAGVVASLDVETGRLESRVEYVSPPEACPPEDPSVVFKAATLTDGRLYVPTTTELLVYEVPSFTCERYVSLPCFNDVHHVHPGTDGTLLVANTGLDMVVEIGPDDTVQGEWAVIDEPLWTRFSRDVDYRKVASTKPHRSHPNFIFYLDGELWVTRCTQRDALCLSHDRPTIPIGQRAIHDGVVRGDSIYFTVVSGEIVVVDATERSVRRRVDLNEIVGDGPPLGWCRGIDVLDDDHVVVGFSRLRPTRWKENIRWVKHRLGGGGSGLRPTRLAMVDLRRERICWEVDLEPAGMNAVFSVHQAE